MKNQIIVYSHGFGVGKDDRGLFSDISAALPDFEHVMFDYSSSDETANTLTVAPFNEQMRKLEIVLQQTRQNNPDSTIDLICHSQGSVVGGLLNPPGLRQVIMITPPSNLNPEQVLRNFRDRPGTEVDTAGISRLPRRDGSTTLVPAEYWVSIANVTPIELYNELAKATSVVAINANQDEVLIDTDFGGLSDAVQVVALDGNHDFTGESRSKLVDTIKIIIVEQ